LAKHNKGDIYIRNDAIFHRDKVCEWEVEQLCVPTGRRDEVMLLAHRTLTGGQSSSS